MRVTLVCFGALRGYLPEGTTDNRAELDLAEGSTIADLVRTIGAPERIVHAALIDGIHSEPPHLLEDGCEVTLMPPFSGGAP